VVRTSRVKRLCGWMFLAALAGCGAETASRTGLQIEIVDEREGAPAPSHLLVDWLDGSRVLKRDVRVPAAGVLAPQGSRLAVVRMELADGAEGPRRAIVRGLVDTSVVSEGTGAGTVAAGTWDTITVTLSAGRRPDRDGDGVPDSIDGCPDDPSSNTLCPEVPDAGGSPDGSGMPVDDDAGGGGPDAAGQDGGPEAAIPADPDAGAHAAPDASLDGPRGGPLGLPERFACGRVLMVVGTTNHGGDRLMQVRLQLLGCEVQTVEGTALTPAMTTGHTLAIISETAVPSKVAAKLRLAEIGVITMQPQLLDDMSLNGSAQSTDWDYAPAAVAITILDPEHPLAGGHRGSLPIFSGPTMVGWSRPDAPVPLRIAALADRPARLLVVGFEKGSTLAFDVTARARRVAFPLSREAVVKLNREGWFLFDAVVRWTAGH
jgi:hypothetical protein